LEKTFVEEIFGERMFKNREALLLCHLHKISLRWKVKGVTERNQTCFASLTPYSLPKPLLKYKYFRGVSGREQGKCFAFFFPYNLAVSYKFDFFLLRVSDLSHIRG